MPSAALIASARSISYRSIYIYIHIYVYIYMIYIFIYIDII